MKLRKHGNAPFNIALIHGGPGAAGELALLAKGLGQDHGILEPFQTAHSVLGQVEELKEVLETSGNPPYILIGYSWGAMLSFIFAAKYPEMVKKLILVSCGPFEEHYTANIMDTRLERLSSDDKRLFHHLLSELDNPLSTNKNETFKALGKLISKADNYDPLPNSEEDSTNCSYEIYQSVWDEARELRASGEMVALGDQILCPVIAIHGEYDPHPQEGVRIPLSSIVKDFRFVLLEKCGHTPWMERQANDTFFDILKQEI